MVGVKQEMSHGWRAEEDLGVGGGRPPVLFLLKDSLKGFLYVDLVFPGERVGGLHWGLVPSIEL